MRTVVNEPRQGSKAFRFAYGLLVAGVVTPWGMAWLTVTGGLPGDHGAGFMTCVTALGCFGIWRIRGLAIGLAMPEVALPWRLLRWLGQALVWLGAAATVPSWWVGELFRRAGSRGDWFCALAGLLFVGMLSAGIVGAVLVEVSRLRRLSTVATDADDIRARVEPT